LIYNQRWWNWLNKLLHTCRTWSTYKLEMLQICDSFDVAISLFVTCNLPSEVFLKHFKELCRVLAPGGKAILLMHTDWSHSNLCTKKKVDPATTQVNIAEILTTLPKYPNTAQIGEAFPHNHNIVTTYFTPDNTGNLVHVTNTSQLVDRQQIWRKSEMMTYSIQTFFTANRLSLQRLPMKDLKLTQQKTLSLKRLQAYNSSNPLFIQGVAYVTYPTALIHTTSQNYFMQ